MPDTHESRPDWVLLSRVVAGTADDHDTVQLERWIGSDATRRRFVESLRTLWQQAGTPVERVDVDEALARIKGLRPPRRRVLRFPSAADGERAARRRRAAGWFARVAMAGGVAAAAVLWLDSWQESRTNAAPARISEISTRRAERAELRLPDGTRVVLGPASKVRYANDYGARQREVTLEGQALFVVTHDERRPFLVHTRRAAATDLGTTFVVRDYDEDPAAEVMVAEGKVSVTRSADGTTQASPTRPAAILEAGELATIVPGRGIRVQRDVAPEPYVDWSRGRLVFEDTPLAEVLAQISRWYDVDARAADSTAARRRLSASYSTEPLVDVLSLVAASLDLRIERHGRVVRFHAQAAPVRGAS